MGRSGDASQVTCVAMSNHNNGVPRVQAQKQMRLYLTSNSRFIEERRTIVRCSRAARALAAVRRENPPELAGSQRQTNRPTHDRGGCGSRANNGEAVLVWRLAAGASASGLRVLARFGRRAEAGFLAANGRRREAIGAAERRTQSASATSTHALFVRKPPCRRRS
jgi:hypothetical protein